MNDIYVNDEELCYSEETTLEDTLVILGDVGINYYLNKKDKIKKEMLSKLPITFFSLRAAITIAYLCFFFAGLNFLVKNIPIITYATRYATIAPSNVPTVLLMLLKNGYILPSIFIKVSKKLLITFFTIPFQVKQLYHKSELISIVLRF